ncbi:unnamed protein product, partial [Scytosiphon promiscuus]
KSSWGEDEDTAFRLLRESLACPLVLAFPDMDVTFELYADATNIGPGATLFQATGDVPREIVFVNKKR